MSRTRNLLLKMSGTLDLPAELLPMVPRVTLEGNQTLHVENHGGVISYGTEKIEIRTAIGTLTVLGQNLEICVMDRAKLLIGGIVQSVDYGAAEHA